MTNKRENKMEGSDMVSTVDKRGRVPIPEALRRKYSIKPGTRIRFREEDGQIILQPITEDLVERACGVAKGSGALQILMEERRREREE